MKIKTSELTGIALDWLVAKCEGKVEQGVYGTPELLGSGLHLHYCDVLLSHPYSPSTDWAEGGPIIESNEIELKSVEEGVWQASNLFDDMEWYHFVGYSPLEAAMRCLVAYKLGEEVEIPKELYED